MNDESERSAIAARMDLYRGAHMHQGLMEMICNSVATAFGEKSKFALPTSVTDWNCKIQLFNVAFILRYFTSMFRYD